MADNEPPMNDLNLLYEITETLGALGPLPRSLQRVLQILAQTMGMRRGTVTILNPETSELQIEVAHGLTAEARRRGRYKLGEGITGRVVETGEPAVVPRVSQEPSVLKPDPLPGQPGERMNSPSCACPSRSTTRPSAPSPWTNSTGTWTWTGTSGC